MVGFMAALQGVVVQRLLRAPCPHCARSGPPDAATRDWLARHGAASSDGPGDVRIPIGCAACHGAGYQGRFALAEVHGVDDDLRDLVTAGAPLSRLKAHVTARGGPSLAAQAARLVQTGRTTPEEVRRVVGGR
jgi:general secretion pathway protein E